MNRTAILIPILLLLIIIPGVVLGGTVSSLTITVYKDGEALQDATVELWLDNTLMYRGVTDTNGTITLANVTTGNYTIYVYHNGTVWKFEKTIDDKTTTLTINITDSIIEYTIGLPSPPFWGKIENYYNKIEYYYDQAKYILLITVGLFFLFLLLIVFALIRR